MTGPPARYTPHGTTTWMAAYNVASGSIIHHQLNPTGTEEDFCYFIQQSCQPLLADPEAEVILLADQLNRHLSESLVKWVAKQIGFIAHLGIKGQCGILHNQVSRMAFLEEHSHRIRFGFTPKHCSWLNPIENYFAKLQRQVIKNASFTSIKQLKAKIQEYIYDYNACLAKPIKWKFKGWHKDKPLAKLKYQAIRA